jgi:hypothetical protein
MIMKTYKSAHRSGSLLNRSYHIQVYRGLLLCLILIGLTGTFQTRIFAQESGRYDAGWYIGTNPVAIPLAFSIKPESKRFLPIIAGNEYGANLAATCFYRPDRSIEARLSLSNVHQIAFVGQFHLGSNFFFQKNNISAGKKGWYFGAYLKYWDFYNRVTHTHFNNICPYISAGYMKAHHRLLFDFRLNQTLAVYSWSDMEYTTPGADWMLSPWPGFIPVLPTFTLTISYKI